MSKCPNCGTTMSCGCQRRTLADGKPGCSKCISPTGKPVKAASASVHRIENNNYSSPIPVVNSAQITNTDK
jgi:hypothetical protein